MIVNLTWVLNFHRSVTVSVAGAMSELYTLFYIWERRFLSWGWAFLFFFRLFEPENVLKIFVSSAWYSQFQWELKKLGTKCTYLTSSSSFLMKDVNYCVHWLYPCFSSFSSSERNLLVCPQTFYFFSEDQPNERGAQERAHSAGKNREKIFSRLPTPPPPPCVRSH